MKKRVNIVAVLFWIAGLVFLVGSFPISLEIRDVAHLAAVSQGSAMIRPIELVNIWSEVRSAFLYGGQLIGIGVLIELVDQIRWNGLHRPSPSS